MKEVIFTDKAPAAIGPYSQAVRGGNTIYCSGQIGLDPATGELVAADVRKQATQAINNLRAVLAAAGAGMDDVCKVNIFLRSMADFGAVNEIYATAFTGGFPARSCVAVAGLPKDALVEIEAIAVLKNS